MKRWSPLLYLGTQSFIFWYSTSFLKIRTRYPAKNGPSIFLADKNANTTHPGSPAAGQHLHTQCFDQSSLTNWWVGVCWASKGIIGQARCERWEAGVTGASLLAGTPIFAHERAAPNITLAMFFLDICTQEIWPKCCPCNVFLNICAEYVCLKYYPCNVSLITHTCR